MAKKHEEPEKNEKEPAAPEAAKQAEAPKQPEGSKQKAESKQPDALPLQPNSGSARQSVRSAAAPLRRKRVKMKSSNRKMTRCSLSKKSLRAFLPSCFQNCKINFCIMILQFCRCGG